MEQQQSSAADPNIASNEVDQSIETGGEDVDPCINLPVDLRKEVKQGWKTSS